ncbi:MAG: hypothetical protein HQK70_11825 [Desulfamplus sp.]|nr:hypothetical protein [Desulfamplus sp.]
MTDKSTASDKNIKSDKNSIGNDSIIEEKDKIDAEMQYLLFFLENADFAYLRHAYPQLSGVEDISVIIQINHDSNRNNLNNYAQNGDYRDKNNSGDSIIDNSNINKNEAFDSDINDFTIVVDKHVLPVKNKQSKPDNILVLRDFPWLLFSTSYL